jgi:hypothetical protein
MAVGLGRLLMMLKVQSQWPLDVCTGADGAAGDFHSFLKRCYGLWLVAGRNIPGRVPTQPSLNV